MLTPTQGDVDFQTESQTIQNRNEIFFTLVNYYRLKKMGNQLTAIAPAQILPLENYFNELPDYSKPTRYFIYSTIILN